MKTKLTDITKKYGHFVLMWTNADKKRLITNLSIMLTTWQVQW